MEGSAANAKSAVHALDIRSRKVLSECMSSPGKVILVVCTTCSFHSLDLSDRGVTRYTINRCWVTDHLCLFALNLKGD